MRISDWGSDVCSSDLLVSPQNAEAQPILTFFTRFSIMLRLLRTRMGVPARTAQGQFCLRRQRERTLERQQPAPQRKQHDCSRDAGEDEIGRASRRERVCRYV